MCNWLRWERCLGCLAGGVDGYRRSTIGFGLYGTQLKGILCGSGSVDVEWVLGMGDHWVWD